MESAHVPTLYRNRPVGAALRSSGGLGWLALVQVMVFALVLETVRWRGLRSSPARNAGGAGARSRSGRLLPRAWRRERWSLRLLAARRFAPARFIAGAGRSELAAASPRC